MINNRKQKQKYTSLRGDVAHWIKTFVGQTWGRAWVQTPRTHVLFRSLGFVSCQSSARYGERLFLTEILLLLLLMMIMMIIIIIMQRVIEHYVPMFSSGLCVHTPAYFELIFIVKHVLNYILKTNCVVKYVYTWVSGYQKVILLRSYCSLAAIYFVFWSRIPHWPGVQAMLARVPQNDSTAGTPGFFTVLGNELIVLLTKSSSWALEIIF